MELIAPIKTNLIFLHYYALDTTGKLCIVRIAKSNNVGIMSNYVRGHHITPMFVFSDNVVAYNSNINYNIADVSPIDEFGMNIDTWLSCEFGDVVLVNDDVFTLNSDEVYCKIDFGYHIQKIKCYEEYLIALTICGKYFAIKNLKKISQIKFDADIAFADITFEHQFLLSNDGDLYKIPIVNIRNFIKYVYDLHKIKSNTKFQKCGDDQTVVDIDGNLWNYNNKQLNKLKLTNVCQYVHYCDDGKNLIITTDRTILHVICGKVKIILSQLPQTEDVVFISYDEWNNFIMIEMTDKIVYCCEMKNDILYVIGTIPMASISHNNKSARKCGLKY